MEDFAQMIEGQPLLDAVRANERDAALLNSVLAHLASCESCNAAFKDVVQHAFEAIEATGGI